MDGDRSRIPDAGGLEQSEQRLIYGNFEVIDIMMRGSLVQPKKNYAELGFIRGSIVRVRMKNFLTYDDCEVLPGPKLNVVIGPNGTGKSAMTHAICLACGGSTGDIGRSSDLSKFVKQGKENEECFVEAELLLSGTKTTTVRRVLNSENRGSKWFRDGNAVKQLEVKELMSQLCIDVDNLCSFMPQDKVGMFSQFSPKEVLQETLKTISLSSSNVVTVPDDDLSSNDSVNQYQNLYEEQKALSDQEAMKEEKKKEKESKQNAYNKIVQEVESMSTEIERLNDRARAIELKSFCEVKLIKVRADEAKRLIKEKDAAIQALTDELQNVKAQYAPLEEKERDLNKQATLMQRQQESMQRQRHEFSQQCVDVKKTLDSNEEKMEEVSVSIVEYEKIRQKEERDVQRLEQEVEGLERKLQEAVNEKDEVGEALDRIKVQMDKLSHDKGVVEDLQREHNSRLQQEISELKNIDKEMNNIMDPKQVFYTRLSNMNDPFVREALQAMKILNENEEEWRRTGRLTGRVYGPVAQYIQVNDPACMIMLEKAIPMNRLMGFVVLNENDRTVLQRELRDRKGLKIDIFTMHNLRTDMPVPYDEATLQSINRSHQIQIQYLSKMLICDDVIRAYLYSFVGLHTALWARTKQSVQSDLFQVLCSRGVNSFKLYVHEQKDLSTSVSRDVKGRIIEYNGKKSRYAQNLPPSTVSTTVTPRNILSTNNASDGEFTQRKQEMQARKETQQGKIKGVEKDLATCMEKINTLNNELLAYKAERTRLNEALKKPQQIQQSLKLKKDNLREKRKKLEDEERVGKKKRFEEYRKVIEVIMKTVQKYNDMMKSHYETNIKVQVIDQLMIDVERQLGQVRVQMEEYQERERAIQHHISSSKADKDRLNKDLVSLEKDLSEKAGLYGGMVRFVHEIYPRVLKEVQESSVDALETRIIQLNAQIKAVVDNPHLQHRYDDAVDKRAQLEKELKVLNRDYEDIEGSMKKRSESWLQAVSATTAKLNESFKSFMEKLQFNGQVVLRETGRLMDYELQLRVSFHKDAPLVDLSGSRHSGGERAVSTVMYLMALQDMTSAPFRVVDEINQGMDERNERLVMDRIVKTCCGDTVSAHQRTGPSSSTSTLSANKKPQYFLVTPKLLQALQALDHDDITILLVWNGPGIESVFKFEDLVHNIKKRKAGDQHGPNSSSSALRGNAHDWDEEDLDVKPKAKRQVLVK